MYLEFGKNWRTRTAMAFVIFVSMFVAISVLTMNGNALVRLLIVGLTLISMVVIVVLMIVRGFHKVEDQRPSASSQPTD
jgi:hypothetical protein